MGARRSAHQRIMPRRSTSSRFLELFAKTAQRAAAGCADILEFEDVQPALTGFILADIALRPPESVRQLNLGESAFSSE